MSMHFPTSITDRLNQLYRAFLTPPALETDVIVDDIATTNPIFPTLLVIGPDLPVPDQLPTEDANHRGIRPSGDSVVVYRPNTWSKALGDGNLTLLFSPADADEIEVTIPNEDITRFIPVHVLC